MLTLFRNIEHDAYNSQLEINQYQIQIAINNQLATTKIFQTFTNPNNFEVDGIYIFPISDDTALSNFALSIDGTPVTGRLLSKSESRRNYRICAEHENPAFLEHEGTKAYVVDVPSIQANSLIRFEFEYSQIIEGDNELAQYTYPLSLAKSGDRQINDLKVEMTIKTDNELRTVYSPSHEINITRIDDRNVQIQYNDQQIDPDEDFKCYYELSNEDFGMSLLTHRADDDEDGYFMLLVSPKYEIKKTEIIEKDFIFVLDQSGSMAGEKVAQAKEALKYCVNTLNDGDRFNLLLFNTRITSFSVMQVGHEEWIGSEPLDTNFGMAFKLHKVKDHRERAMDFINDIKGTGGTNINGALLTALAEKPDPERPRIIVFLTDGCPTAGETNETAILNNIAKANDNQSRIFVFGVGYDVNVHLLDKLAEDNGGTRNYVTPDENIEVAVSSLFNKMNEPVLVDVALNFGDITVKDIAPSKLPDMFRGEQFTLLGRFENYGETTIKLRGSIGADQKEFTKTVQFKEIQNENGFLPTLWATRRIAELVDDAALNGYTDEVSSEIERLCKEYDVVTPYTQFQSLDDGTYRRQYKSTISEAYHPDMTVEQNVMHSREMRFKKEMSHVLHEVDLKHVGLKTFHRQNGILVDSSYDGISERKEIEYGSNEYFDLASQSRELAKSLKLGSQMIICHDNINYEIIEPKK
ncbi:VWA domain-containing protein [Candidatus Poribacteria bacterium]|nr:VWA domain-containing protein [Candidatus Poribacteria bacterium]